MALNSIDHHTMDDAIPKSAFAARLQNFPALMALCIQLGTALSIGALLLLGTYVASQLMGTHLVLPMAAIIFLQSFISSACSQYVGMARWWQWIHFCFPVLVWLMLMFTIPTEVYLLGFLVTASIYWTTFRTQVPYYPSGLSVWQKVSALTHQYQAHYGAEIRVMEIGSGLGGFARYIAKTHPEATVEGVEVAPLPWLVSRVIGFLQHSNSVCRLGNYNQLNFADYNIVFAYLSPAAMPALWLKASQELNAGGLLISLEFPIPNLSPTQRIPGDAQSPDLYIYQK